MASVGDVLKEFIINISYAFNEESEKKVLTGLDRIEAETKRLSAAEQRAAQQTTAAVERERKRQTAIEERERKKQADLAIAQAKQIHAAMEQYAVAGLRKVAAAAASVTAAFAGFRVLSDSFQNFTALDNFSRHLGVAASDVKILGVALESMGGSKNDALGMIQGVSSALLQNRGNLELLRSIGVTESKAGLNQMRQIADALNRLAKEYGEDVAFLYAQQLNLSESQYRLLRNKEDFEASIARTQQIFDQWGIKTKEQIEIVRAFGDTLGELKTQAQAVSDKILTAVLPAINSFLKPVNDALLKNAGAIGGSIDTISDSLNKWAKEKGDQFADWLEKVSQPGTKERDDFVRWLENTQKAALRLASSIGSVASALHTLLTPLKAIGNFIEKHPGLISVLTWSPHRQLLTKGLEALEDGAGEVPATPAPATPAAPAPAPEALNWWDRLHRRLGTGRPEVPAPAPPTPIYEPYVPTPAPRAPTPVAPPTPAPAPEPYVPTPEAPGPLGRILSLFKDHDFTGEGQDKQADAADKQAKAADTFKKSVEEDKANREQEKGFWDGLKSFLGGLTSRLGLTGPMGVGGEGGGVAGGAGGGGAGGGAGAGGAGAAISGPGLQVAKRLVGDLQKELGITKEQAEGVAGSLAAETGGFSQLQELNPRGGRGGLGYAQWTGPRRRAFEAWAKENKLDPTSYEANKGFLVHELKTSQAAELTRLKQATTREEAARTFTGSAREAQGFLRPGAEHYGPSISYAERIAKGETGGAATGFDDPAVAGGGAGAHRDPTPIDPAQVTRNRTGMEAVKNVLQAGGIRTTSDYRGPGHELSRANPTSLHTRGRAIDLGARTPEEGAANLAKARQVLEAQGYREGVHYSILDETGSKRSRHATASHLHLSLTPAGIAKGRGEEAGTTPEPIVRPGERGYRGPDAANRVRANAERLGSNENAPGQPGTAALSSGPIANDNSQRITQKNNFNTTITASDASTIGRDVRRNQEAQMGMALGHLRTTVRA